MKTLNYLAVIFFSLASVSAFASASVKDIKAGEKKAAQCMGCHGAKGISSIPQNPSLAGQQMGYLEAQLNMFRSGRRDSPVMKAIASGLQDADVDNLAAFFSSLPANSKIDSKAKIPADAKSKFAMCASCHGASAEGNGGFPRLANQNAEYLTAQLQAFKNGTRTGMPMSGIAKNLTDQDIQSLSVYLRNLKPGK